MRTPMIAALVVALVVATSVSGVALAQTSATHVVRPGETLFSIARQNNVTVQSIASANGITNPNLIFVGEVLIIPGVSPAATTPAAGGTTSYTVVAGDTLSAIAQRFKVSMATLVALNGLANPNLIFVGQVLKIPASSQAPAMMPTPAPTAMPTAAPSMMPTPSMMNNNMNGH